MTIIKHDLWPLSCLGPTLLTSALLIRAPRPRIFQVDPVPELTTRLDEVRAVSRPARPFTAISVSQNATTADHPLSPFSSEREVTSDGRYPFAPANRSIGVLQCRRHLCTQCGQTSARSSPIVRRYCIEQPCSVSSCDA